MHPERFSSFNPDEETSPAPKNPPEITDRKNSEIEREITGEPANQAQKIFENVYNQLRPRPGADNAKAGKRFVEVLEENQALLINKIDPSAPINQSLEKIWADGIGEKLTRFSNDPPEFERRKADSTKAYLTLSNHIDRLTKSGEVDQRVAKLFLENFRALKTVHFYNEIIRNPKRRTEAAGEKYYAAFKELYDLYGEDKIVYHGNFYHFNIKNHSNTDVTNRVYLSANIAGSPEKLVSAWKAALTTTGLQDKIYFKMGGALNNRYETIVVYQTNETTDEEMGKIIGAFHTICPEDAREKNAMPSSVPIAQGISYAPSPKNLNNFFSAMDLRTNNDELLQISYNEMIAGFTLLSFELAYKDFTASRTEKPNPKDLKDTAGKYFEQMIKLAGINPQTMVPNAQGGKLPAWAEKLSKE